MASQWRQVQHNLQQEKIDISRFMSEEQRELHDGKPPARHNSHHGGSKVHFSVSLDEETLDAIKQDAEFQGLSPQDLVRWLLDQYADGQLQPKQYPLI